MQIAADLVDPQTLPPARIGGLDDVLQQLHDTVLLPLKYSHRLSQLTSAGSNHLNALAEPPRGVLLYGPPGCGKSLIVRAIAKQSGARLINLQGATLFDKWYISYMVHI